MTVFLKDRLVPEDNREVLVYLVRPEQREVPELQEQLDPRAMPDGLDRRATREQQATPVLQVYQVPLAHLVMLVPEVHRGRLEPSDPLVTWDLLDHKVHLEAQVLQEPLDLRGSRDRRDHLDQVDRMDNKDLRESKVTQEVQARLDPKEHLDKRVRKDLRVKQACPEHLVLSVLQALPAPPVALGLRVTREHLDLLEITDYKVQ